MKLVKEVPVVRNNVLHLCLKVCVAQCIRWVIWQRSYLRSIEDVPHSAVLIAVELVRYNTVLHAKGSEISIITIAGILVS